MSSIPTIVRVHAVVVRRATDREPVHPDADEGVGVLHEPPRQVAVDGHALVLVRARVAELEPLEAGPQQQQTLALQLVRVGLDVLDRDDRPRLAPVRQVDEQDLVARVAERLDREVDEVDAVRVEVVRRVQVGAEVVGQVDDRGVERLAVRVDHGVLLDRHDRLAGERVVLRVDHVREMNERHCCFSFSGCDAAGRPTRRGRRRLGGAPGAVVRTAGRERRRG
jgi:hypothetical protein